MRSLTRTRFHMPCVWYPGSKPSQAYTGSRPRILTESIDISEFLTMVYNIILDQSVTLVTTNSLFDCLIYLHFARASSASVLILFLRRIVHSSFVLNWLKYFPPGRNAAHGGFQPTRIPIHGWFKVPPALPLLFCTRSRIHAGMRPPPGRDR